MSLSRIRLPYLREIAEARVRSGLSEKDAVAETLGVALVGALRSPEVELTGEPLSESRSIQFGSPGTAMPGDVSPELLEAIIRSYSEEDDLVLHLFATSATPLLLGRALKRDVRACDEYCCDVEGLYSGSLIDPEMSDHVLGGNSSDLLFVQLPQAGIVDRRALLYPNADYPSYPHLHWESLSHNDFISAIKRLFETWASTVRENGYLVVQVGWCRWRGKYSLPWFDVDEILWGQGWKCQEFREVRINEGRCAVKHPALSNAKLLIFQRRTK